VLYPYPPDGWAAWRVVASVAFLLGTTVGAFALVRRAPWVTVGWLWFAGTLVPVIGVVQLGAQAMADRYTYFPAIGLFIAAVWSVPALPFRLRVGAVAAVIALLLALGALTFRQAGLWSDEERLYRHTLAVTGRNARMHAVLATLLRSEGRIEEAYAEILESNQLWPGNPHDLTSLGIIARETGRLDVAEKALRGAVQAGPGFAPGWYALADLLRRTGRGGEAIEALDKAAAMAPENGTYWAELGIQLHGAGRTDEAADAFAEAVRVAPDDYEVQRNAGIFGALTGRWDFAVEAFSRAARLRPETPEITRRLTEARERARRPTN
jgi:tetratricopeptide (TPR) repeat protein